jgi:large subunit ribosomal protein L13Ae
MNVVDTLEEKRKQKGKAYYEKKKTLLRIKSKAEQSVGKELESVNAKLAGFGY